MSAYERARPFAEELERTLYAALEAADRWVGLMDVLAAEEEAKEQPNAELVRRYGHLRSEAEELARAMEGRPLEALLRIVDRVLMIKQSEEGRFV